MGSTDHSFYLGLAYCIGLVLIAGYALFVFAQRGRLRRMLELTAQTVASPNSKGFHDQQK